MYVSAVQNLAFSNVPDLRSAALAHHSEIFRIYPEAVGQSLEALLEDEVPHIQLRAAHFLLRLNDASLDEDNVHHDHAATAMEHLNDHVPRATEILAEPNAAEILAEAGDL
jgi:hypothetical protein